MTQDIWSCFWPVQHDVDRECVSGEMMQARNKSSHHSIEGFMLLVLPWMLQRNTRLLCLSVCGRHSFCKNPVHFICLTVSGYYRKKMMCFWCSFWSNDGPSAVATCRSSSTVQPDPEHRLVNAVKMSTCTLSWMTPRQRHVIHSPFSRSLLKSPLCDVVCSAFHMEVKAALGAWPRHVSVIKQ